jgi:tetratricopeptide (TPR) repeat protein
MVSPLKLVLEDALSLHRAGRLEEAEAKYREILVLRPKHFESLRLLGVIAHQRGDYAAAVRHIDAALETKPHAAEAFNSRGNALTKMKRLDEALANFDRAIALKPAYAKAFCNRGGVLHRLKRLDDALASYERAIALEPAYAQAFNGRANVLKEMTRFEDALASYDRAIVLDPRFADAHKNRGTVLQELGRQAEALISYDQTLVLDPGHAEALNNRGTALHEQKRLAEALASYDQAIALKPGFANAHVNRGMTKLLDGRLQEGWEDLEWRWKVKPASAKRPAIDAPDWKGEALFDRRIAIYAEQGLGDVIQFARFLPFLARQGAKVTFLAPAKLVRLLAPLSPEIEIVASINDTERFDFQCALLSLPLRLGVGLQSIPGGSPYLSAEKDRIARWAEVLGDHGFRIGIAWQGSQAQRLARERSVPLAEVASLSRLPGVRLISLQKHHGLDQIAGLPAGCNVEILPDDCDGGSDAFIDTAAVMAHLDLVVTPDTSIAHLAGALGYETWVMLRYVPDWRWLLDRDDCPWYPAMRLFRQDAEGDWRSVFSRMEKALASHPRYADAC